MTSMGLGASHSMGSPGDAVDVVTPEDFAPQRLDATLSL